jgi:Carboxypeptidase regulatory-like domain
MGLRLACGMLLVVASITAQETTGRITGTVVDAVGSVIPNAAIAIVSPVSLEIKTDATGEFAIVGLAPDFYTLQFSAPGFETRDIATTVAASRERSLGRIVLEFGAVPNCEQVLSGHLIFDKKIRSGAKPSLSGVVRDEAGRPLKNTTVNLEIAETSQTIAIAKTNDKGEFQFLDLSSGVYRISSDGSLVFNLRVRRNHEMRVLVTLPPPPLCL